MDINDNTPYFVKPSNISAVHRVKLNDPAGQVILTVKAVDPDEGLNGEVQYSLVRNEKKLFRVKEKSGEITLSRLLTSEEKGEHVILVRATDRGQRFSRSSLMVRRERRGGQRGMSETCD